MADLHADSLVNYILAAVGTAAVAVVAAVVGVIAWMSRALFGDVKARMKEQADRVEAVGNRNDASNKLQMEELKKVVEQTSENRTYRATNDLRLGHVERDVDGLKRIVDDHTGFLQSLGFRKRDGPEGGG